MDTIEKTVGRLYLALVDSQEQGKQLADILTKIKSRGRTAKAVKPDERPSNVTDFKGPSAE